MLSLLNLKDAYYTIKLSDSSKPYYDILPYFGSASYIHQRMLIGLSTSPAKWQSYINAILSSTPDRSKYSAIMDDVFLYNSKHGHLKYLKELLKELLKIGLKISP